MKVALFGLRRLVMFVEALLLLEMLDLVVAITALILTKIMK